MGNTSSQTEDEWSLDQVVSLLTYYKDQCFDFALDRQSFERFLNKLKNKLADRLWKKLDPQNAGIISAMECIATLAVLAGKGRLSDKVDFLFSLFDLRETGLLSYDELFILTASVLSGTVKLTGKGHVPEDLIVEKVIDQAFRDAEKDTGATFALEEYRAWVTKYLDLENETLEVSDLLVAFDVLEEPNLLPDCFVDLNRGDVASKIDLHHELHRSIGNSDDVGGNGMVDLLKQCAALGILNEDSDDGSSAAAGKGKGDDSSASLAPSAAGSRSTASSSNIPSITLALEHTYGYASRSAHNNLSYLATGEIIYPVGKLVIIVSPPTKQQRSYRFHKKEVGPLSLHPGGSIVATGEIGKSPQIHIWDTITAQPQQINGGGGEGKRPIAIIKGLHLRGIAHLAFSPSGKYLASLGDGPSALLVIHEWNHQQPARGPIGNGIAPIVRKLAISDQYAFGLCWHKGDEILVTAGTNIVFWTGSTTPGQSLQRIEGKWGKTTTKQMLLCVKEYDGKIQTGTVGGQLYGWAMETDEGDGDGGEGEGCVVLCQGGPTIHEGSVLSLSTDGTNLFSGGKDGLIKLWDKSLISTTAEYQVPCAGARKDGVIEQRQHQIKAISATADQRSILVGTHLGEIHVLTSDGRSKCITAGHSAAGGASARALDSHPTKPYVITGGDDGVLRVWNIETHELMTVRVLESHIRALAYSPEGKHIVVAFGGRVAGVESKLAGTFYILNAATLETETTVSEFTDSIMVATYSPDGSLLAFGCAAGRVHVYNAAGDFVSARFIITNEIALSIPRVHFSMDGAYLRLQDAAKNVIAVVETTSGAAVSMGELNMEETRWWARPTLFEVDTTCQGDLIVAPLGDKAGVVGSKQEDGAIVGYRAHAAAASGGMISSVITSDQKYQLTLGEHDLALMVWRIQASDKVEADYAAVTDEVDVDEEVLWHNQEVLEASIPGAQARAVLVNGSFDFLLLMREKGGKGTMMMTHDSATRPWLTACHEPARLPDNINGEAPTRALALEWIHGMSPPTKVKGVITYNALGQMVYLAGRVGVIHDPTTSSQRYLLDALSSDPSCLAINAARTVVGVGQSKNGLLVLWDAKTASFISHIDTSFTSGISQLAFNGNHTLAIASRAPPYQLAIYDIQHPKGLLLTTGRSSSSPSRTLGDMAWLSPTTLVTCGARFFTTWTLFGEVVLQQKRGSFGRKGVIQTIQCIAGLSDRTAVTGQKDGSIYLWEDGKVTASLNHCHEGPVNVIAVRSGLLCTGGQDGRIHILTPTLSEAGATLTLPGPIRQLVPSHLSPSLLIATAQGEAYEVPLDESKPNCLIHAHHQAEKQQTWALATHPKKAEYVTGGDDGRLCVWDAVSHQLLRSRSFDAAPIRALAYSAEGDLLVAGTGSPEATSEKERAGFIVVMKAKSLDEVFKTHIAQTWVRCLKFAHDDTFLAVAVEDSSVFLLDAQTQDYMERGLCKGPTGSEVDSMDFTDDSKHLQITTSSKNIWYFSTASCKRLKQNTAQLRDELWTTWTAPLGWPVNEIWSTVPPGIDVLSVDRSHDGTILACVDDCGRLRTYKYPCVTENALFNCYRGHSDMISICRWLKEDSHLVTMGAHDGCIYQWKVDRTEVKDHSLASLRQDEAALAPELQPISRSSKQAWTLNDLAIISTSNTAAMQGGLVEPVPMPTIPKGLPETDDLVLEHVYGIRVHDTRASLSSLGNGNIVYLVGCLAVIQSLSSSPRTSSQRFYNKHTDEVISLVVHPDGFIVATGQVGPCADVHIWDSRSLATLQVLSGLHQIGISHLAFIADGHTLLTAGQDKMNTIALYNWEAARDCIRQQPISEIGPSAGYLDPTLARWLDHRSISSEREKNAENTNLSIYKHAGLVASTSTTMSRLYDIAIAPDGGQICGVGRQFIRFWDQQLTSSSNAPHCSGVLGGEMLQQALISVTYLTSDLVVAGSSSGELHLFKQTHLSQSLRAHKGPINVIRACRQQPLFISGGKDGIAAIWNFAMESLGKFSLPMWRGLNDGISMTPPPPPLADINAIRSLVFHDDGSKVLLTTSGAEVLVWTRASDDAVIAVESHNVNQTWALATHPKVIEFATGGDDRVVRVWDGSRHELLRKRQLDSSVRALAYSPDGKLLAAGFGGGGIEGVEEEVGTFVVLNASTLDVLHKETQAPCKAAVCDIKFSPDGLLLAVASNDCVIHVYETKNEYNKRGTCKGHHQPVVSIDFSENGQYLQSCSGPIEPSSSAAAGAVAAKGGEEGEADNGSSSNKAIEILYWTLGFCKQIRPKFNPEIHEIKWSSWSLLHGWPVLGHIKSVAGGGGGEALLSSTDRSKDGKLVASMDRYGKVRLSGHPCIDPEETMSYVYGGHGGLTGGRCRWTSKDSHLITVGGGDRAIMQWRHARSRFAPSTAPVLDRLGGVDSDVDLVYPERSRLQEAINEGVDRPTAASMGEGDGSRGASYPSRSSSRQAWRSVIEAPSMFSKDASPSTTIDKSNPPSGSLKLSWIHGYNAQRLRNQVKYLADGKIVYSVGSIAVIYDPLSHTQRHFCAHTDEIVSLAVSDDGRYVATGQVGRTPRVYVWDSLTLAEISMLRGRLEKALVSLAFSHSGSLLACVGNDEQHSIAVYDWRSESCLAVGQVGKSCTVLCMEFSPNDNTLVIGTSTDVTFHTLGSTRYLRRRGVVWGKRYIYQPALCCKHLDNGILVTGMYDGSLYFWEDNVCKGMTLAHESGVPVQSIILQGYHLITGGSDGRLKVWKAAFEESIELAHFPFTAIKSLDCSFGGSLAVAIDDGRIFELNLSTTPTTPSSSPSSPFLPPTKGPRVLVNTHAHGAITSVSTHPHNKLEFITAGSDKTLRFWNAGRCSMVRSKVLDAPISATAYSPDGSLLAIGYGEPLLKNQSSSSSSSSSLLLKNKSDGSGSSSSNSSREEDGGGDMNGTMLILNGHTMDLLFKDKKAVGSIRCLRFSPDGSLLACASHDTRIYLFEILPVKKSFSLRYTYKHHTSFVTCLNFTADGRFLQSSSGGKVQELLYWNTVTGKQMVHGGSELKDVKWAGWTMPYGWPVQGLWGTDGEEEEGRIEVMAVDRSKSGKVVAAVDDHGQLRVYHWPVAGKEEGAAAGWLYMGHAPWITSCRWTAEDAYLITTGGEDQAIFQWKWTPGPKDQEQEEEEAAINSKARKKGPAAASLTSPGRSKLKHGQNTCR